MNVKKVKMALEQIAHEQKMEGIRKERIARAAFMEHKKTCAHCAQHFDMMMQAKAQQEAGEEAHSFLSRLSSIASQTLTKPTMH